MICPSTSISAREVCSLFADVHFDHSKWGGPTTHAGDDDIRRLGPYVSIPLDKETKQAIRSYGELGMTPLNIHATLSLWHVTRDKELPTPVTADDAAERGSNIAKALYELQLPRRLGPRRCYPLRAEIEQLCNAIGRVPSGKLKYEYLTEMVENWQEANPPG